MPVVIQCGESRERSVGESLEPCSFAERRRMAITAASSLTPPPHHFAEAKERTATRVMESALVGRQSNGDGSEEFGWLTCGNQVDLCLRLDWWEPLRARASAGPLDPIRLRIGVPIVGGRLPNGSQAVCCISQSRVAAGDRAERYSLYDLWADCRRGYL
ncbi:MAG: hypothetical protein M2R45_03746 [Verrucomicrobia subdivision 3 bacterium]|nr:hypothetical protein [Limisphaerales bacterium]MCS1416930.1 hypothetical protein [Limisphaerales bacterium]